MTAVRSLRHDCRDAFAATLIELADADPRIVAVVNDSVGSSKLGGFRDRFPERLINVGIAEQDMVGVGAGLANGGKIPFVSAAACFLTARAMEQIKVDAAYSQHHLVLVGQSPGMAYGELGPTHHSIEDLSWLRTIPGLTVLVPSDPVETAEAVRWAAAHDGPVFIRVSRMGVPDVNPPDYRFVPGRAVPLREGSDVTIIATGTTVGRALDAADQLATEGVSARVLSMPTIKPLDEDAVVAAARETGGSSPSRRRSPVASAAPSPRPWCARTRCRSASSACGTGSRRPAPSSGCSTTSASPPPGSPRPPGSWPVPEQ